MDKNKIISLIPSYNPHNEYVKTVINELNKFSKVILFTTEPHNLDVSETIYYDKGVGRELVYKPREWLTENIEADWEYALYNEDDIFIPEISFRNVIELYKTLPSPFIPGLIRYEFDERDNTKRYFDMNPVHAIHRGYNGTIKEQFPNEQIWEPWNLHSGNWVFSKADIKNMIKNNVFETFYKQNGYQYGNCDQLESAASVPYLFYIKVYPYDFEKVECKHLPTKYINFSINPTYKDIKDELRSK